MGARSFLTLVLALILTAVAAGRLGHAAPAPSSDGRPAAPDTAARTALTEAARAALTEARLLPVEGAEPQTPAAAPELAAPTTFPAPLTFASDRATDFDLYTQAAAGSPAVPLAGGPGHDVTPVWSPDGGSLVFVSTRDGDADLYLREAGGSERPLTTNPADDIHPAWSPGGQHIIFSSNRTGLYQIYTVPASGGTAQQVGVVDGNALYPRYAPDGSRISYMRASIALPACDWNWDIWLMDPDGGNQSRVTTQLGGDLYANWTPDGRLLYASCRNLIDADLYAFNVTTGAETRLTDWSFNDEWNAVVGPDGETIAFNGDAEGNIEIYTMPLAGGPAANVSLNGADDVAPSWQSGGEPADPCAAATALPPVLIVNGWGGSEGHSGLDDGSQVRYLRTHMAAHGYVEGCNLFYAIGTSPHRWLHVDSLSRFGRSNAAIVRENVCHYATVVDGVYGSTWDGHFDLIGYSYGGLRARAFLENDDHYDFAGAICGAQDPGRPVHVRNLFTLGTPHGGEYPTLPLSFLIGLSAAGGGPTDGIDPEIPAIIEMLPPYRAVQNVAYSQPEGVHYYLLGGDVNEQGGASLQLIHELWRYAAVVPNDLAVHRSSAQMLSLPPLNLLYPLARSIHTNDLHGQVPPPLPLHDYRSFVNPSTMFDTIICHIMGLSTCTPVAETPLPTPSATATAATGPRPALVEQLQQPHTMTAAPTIDLAAGALQSGQTVTGTFALDGEGPSQVTLGWTTGDVELALADPTGRAITPTVAAADPNAAYLYFDGGFGLTAAYAFTDPLSGSWTYTLTAGALTEPALYRLLVRPPVPIAVAPSAPGWTPAGNTALLTATVTISETTPLAGGAVSARVLRPDDGTDHVTLLDDGAHGDGASGDGVFGAVYTPTTGGVYSLLFTATGTYQGTSYERTAAAYLTAGPDTAHLAGSYADEAVPGDGGLLYEALAVTADLSVTEASTYTLSAELYVGDLFLDHAATTLFLNAGTGTATVHFDGDAIRAAGRDGPYTVRNVLLLEEAGPTLLIEHVDEAHTTAAYDHDTFGTMRRLFLPVVGGQ